MGGVAALAARHCPLPEGFAGDRRLACLATLRIDQGAGGCFWLGLQPSARSDPASQGSARRAPSKTPLHLFFKSFFQCLAVTFQRPPLRRTSTPDASSSPSSPASPSPSIAPPREQAVRAERPRALAVLCSAPRSQTAPLIARWRGGGARRHALQRQWQARSQRGKKGLRQWEGSARHGRAPAQREGGRRSSGATPPGPSRPNRPNRHPRWGEGVAGGTL